MEDAQRVWQALTTIQKEGKLAALATVIRTQGSVPRRPGTKMLIYPNGEIVGTVGGGNMEARVIELAQTVMRNGTAQTANYNLTDIQRGDPGICGGSVEVFVEPIGWVPTILVIGCGHVGKAVAELAKWSGFRVVVSDDRTELCTPENIPDMDAYYPVPIPELFAEIEVTTRTYVAAVTRGLPVDIELFPRLLAQEPAYIGLIGSKRRWKLTRDALAEEKQISEDDIARIKSPIGLDIGAETPHEIAISIMAEIVQAYRQKA